MCSVCKVCRGKGNKTRRSRKLKTNQLHMFCLRAALLRHLGIKTNELPMYALPYLPASFRGCVPGLWCGAAGSDVGVGVLGDERGLGWMGWWFVSFSFMGFALLGFFELFCSHAWFWEFGSQRWKGGAAYGISVGVWWGKFGEKGEGGGGGSQRRQLYSLGK